MKLKDENCKSAIDDQKVAERDLVYKLELTESQLCIPFHKAP